MTRGKERNEVAFSEGVLMYLLYKGKKKVLPNYFKTVIAASTESFCASCVQSDFWLGYGQGLGGVFLFLSLVPSFLMKRELRDWNVISVGHQLVIY